MIDLLALLGVLVAASAGGLALLDGLGAAPRAAGDRLLAGCTAGLGLAGAAGLALAEGHLLRVGPILLLGAAAVALGGASLAATTRALHWPRGRAIRVVVAVGLLLLMAELPTMLAPPVGGDQTKYHLAYPRLYAAAHGLVATPWSFWGQMQYLENFVFAIGFALRGDVLARLLNGTSGVLAACAVALLARRHLGRAEGRAAGVLFFTLPITWSLMTRAGSDLAVVLFTALAVEGWLEWVSSAQGEGAGALRRSALMAGFAGGSKVMGLLVPGLLGVGVLLALWRQRTTLGRSLGTALAFGLIAMIAAAPCYVRNAVDTGNPLYPFGFGIFGGRHWSAAAAEYLSDYYRQYQGTWAARREGGVYIGAAVTWFPWDLTMTPGSFEKGSRQALDVSPFVLAFAPAVLLVRRRRNAALAIAALGLADVAIIAGGAWAHPRYVLAGVVLLLTAAVAGARTVLGQRGFVAVVAVTVLSNVIVTSRLLLPLWPDQVRVALGRLSPDAFLRRHSDRFVFWERANQAVPAEGRVLVLEKIPHPYYIDRPFLLASYLEQGLIDYRVLDSAEAIAGAARLLGVTHVAVDVEGLDAAGDPFEARVTKLWRDLLTDDCTPVLRAGGFGLYTLRSTSATATIPGGASHG